MKVSVTLRYCYVLLLLLGPGQELWADITIDLGASRIATNQIEASAFSDLNDMPVTGTVSMDFAFSKDAFVRLFNQYLVPSGPDAGSVIGTTASFFEIGLNLQTSASGLVGFLQGTGYITDGAGNPIAGHGVTGSASSDDGRMSIGLFPLCLDDTGAPNLELLRPLDFYGVHFDLIFPDVPSVKVTGAEFCLFDSGGEFGIGPNIPSEIPEPSASMITGVGAVACVLFGRRARPHGLRCA